MKKNVLYFLGGFGVGAAISSFVTYMIVMKKAEKEFWAENETDENDDEDHESDGINEEYKENRNYINIGEGKKYETPPEIREKLLKNWEVPSAHVSESEMAENMHPVDSDEDFGEEDDDREGLETLTDEEYDEEMEMAEAEEAYYKRKEEMNLPPEIIDMGNLGAVDPTTDTQEWIYWAPDDIITDEDENEIPDYMRFVGECLDFNHFRDNDEEEMYVLSHEYDCLYHIVKYFASFADKKMQEMGYTDENENKNG